MAALFDDYTMRVDKAAACKPGYQPLYCVAELSGDISPVFPYLNRILGAISINKEPPAMLIKKGEHTIALEPRKIEICDVAGEGEAKELLTWLQEQVNTTWENRANIEPTHGVAKPASVMEIVRLLPRSNCSQCGQTGCMAFAGMVASGEVSLAECTELSDVERQELQNYLDSCRRP